MHLRRQPKALLIMLLCLMHDSQHIRPKALLLLCSVDVVKIPAWLSASTHFSKSTDLLQHVMPMMLEPHLLSGKLAALFSIWLQAVMLITSVSACTYEHERCGHMKLIICARPAIISEFVVKQVPIVLTQVSSAPVPVPVLQAYLGNAGSCFPLSLLCADA